MDKLAVLRQYFGFPAFRAGQQTLIDAVLSGRDALGVMPTGGGKSLCYELPALLLPGMTLVVSPLISLMKDQVMALRNAGIPAGCINSSMSLDELRETYRDARYGAYKLLYVAPERLLTDGVRLSFGRSTSKRRLGRSKPVTTVSGSCSCKIRMISARTCAVAVAVKAATAGRRGSRCKNSTIFK